MRKEKVDIAHSVHDRLLKVSSERKEDFQIILTRFAFERFLNRLQKSKYSKQFILKGAFLLNLWTKQYYRPTRDIDFLAEISNQPDVIHRIFKEICEIEVEDDGLVFNSENISVTEIIEGSTYHGIRVKLKAMLKKAGIHLQFDIGFGDKVSQTIKEIEYPSLLDFPRPKVMVYPPESLISEKVHAMVDRGIQNSRMKDFYDIYSLINVMEIDKVSLGKAIKATFSNRKVEIPKDVPIALTDEFAYDKDKIAQWRQFIRKNDLSNAPENLKAVIDEIRNFLHPIFVALNEEKKLQDMGGHK